MATHFSIIIGNVVLFIIPLFSHLDSFASSHDSDNETKLSVSISGPSTVYVNQSVLYSINIPAGRTMIYSSWGGTTKRISWGTPGEKTISVSVIYDTGEEFSSVRKVNVYHRLYPGSISEAHESNCGGFNPALIPNSIAASGGNGPIRYQWEIFQNNGNGWRDIDGANGLSYDHPTYIWETTQFRRRVTDGVFTTHSSGTSIKSVYDPLYNWIIYSGEMICPGDVMTTPIEGLEPTGGNGTYSYEWQYFNGSAWQDYPNSNQQSFLPPNPLYEDLRIRRKVISGECSDTGRELTIKVYDIPSGPGELSISGAACHGESSRFLFAPTSGSMQELMYLDVLREGEWTELRTVSTSMRVFILEEDRFRIRYEHPCGTIYSSIFIPRLVELCPSDDKNFIIVHTARSETKSKAAFAALTVEDRSTSIDYFDGLGRLWQQIAVLGSPARFDQVIPVDYDEYNREEKKYLPFADNSRSGKFKNNAIAQQYFFPFYRDKIPFYQEEYEISPRSRVVKGSAPGYKIDRSYVKQFHFDFNEPDQVRRLSIIGEELINNGFYREQTLRENKTIDEDLHEIIEYTDLQGKTVLKRNKISNDSFTETYFIYDDFNLLRAVLPPEASSRFELEYLNATAGEKEDFLDRWAFRYQYDDRNRMTVKKVPGAKKTLMIYDRWDRLVLTQDGNQRDSSEWLFTKYDAFNRPVITGLIETTQTQASLRAAVKASSERYEELDPSRTHQYTEVTFPTFSSGLISEYLTITYYDTYDFVGGSSLAGTSYQLPPEMDHPNVDDFHLLPVALSQVKGQVTGTKTKVLGTDTYLESITYYDDKYRMIQLVSQHHLGEQDVLSTQYDFVGNARRIKTEHKIDAGTTTMLYEYSYDHANRLMEGYHTLDGGNQVHLFSNSYNELGELQTKRLHVAADNTSASQEVDYAYNIRGWLKTINESGLSGFSGTPDPKDLFSMELMYNTLLPGISTN